MDTADRRPWLSVNFDLRKKVRNVQRDPRVALSVEGPDANAMGLQEHLVVHGSGRVEPGGAVDLLHRLAQVYLGPGAEFPPPEFHAAGYVLRIRPERVSGVGPW